MTAIINLSLSRSKREKVSHSTRLVMLYRVARWKQMAARAECWHLMSRTKILTVFRFPDHGGMPKKIQPNWPRSFFANPDLADMVGRMDSESRDSQFYPSCGGFELSCFLGKHDRQGCKNFQSPTQPIAQHTTRSDTLRGILCCH